MRRLLLLPMILTACGEPEVEIASLGGLTWGDDLVCEAKLEYPPPVVWDAGSGVGLQVALELRNVGGEAIDVDMLDVELDNQEFWAALPAKRRAPLSVHVEPDGGTATAVVELLDAELAAQITAADCPLSYYSEPGPLRMRLSAEGGASYEYTVGVCNRCLASQLDAEVYTLCVPGTTSPVGCALGQRGGWVCEP